MGLFSICPESPDDPQLIKAVRLFSSESIWMSEFRQEKPMKDFAYQNEAKFILEKKAKGPRNIFPANSRGIIHTANDIHTSAGGNIARVYLPPEISKQTEVFVEVENLTEEMTTQTFCIAAISRVVYAHINGDLQNISNHQLRQRLNNE